MSSLDSQLPYICFSFHTIAIFYLIWDKFHREKRQNIHGTTNQP
jgi:hypothetical protein